MNYGKIILEREEFVALEQKDEATYAIRAIVHEFEDERVDCIEAIVYHEPTQEDYDALNASYLEDLKRSVLKAIEEYDKSEAVNGFVIGGVTAWLDKDTRVGLVNLLDSQKAEGHTETTLWLNGAPIVLGVDAALSMLRRLEVYAGQCYNQTEAHKAAITELTTASDVDAYDYTAGYPQHPVFTIDTAE